MADLAITSETNHIRLLSSTVAVDEFDKRYPKNAFYPRVETDDKLVIYSSIERQTITIIWSDWENITVAGVAASDLDDLAIRLYAINQ